MDSDAVIYGDDEDAVKVLRRYHVSEESVNALMARGLTMDVLCKLKKEYTAIDNQIGRSVLLSERFGRYGIDLVYIVSSSDAQGLHV